MRMILAVIDGIGRTYHWGGCFRAATNDKKQEMKQALFGGLFYCGAKSGILTLPIDSTR